MTRPDWLATPQQRMLALLFLLFVLANAMTFAAVLALQPFGVDWGPMWAGARIAMHDPAGAYDFARVTAAQEPLIGIVPSLRPFVYPPSALLLFMPFAALPVLPSFILWTALTAAFFAWAAARIGAQWWLLLMVPSAFLVEISGQTTFLMGGLMLTGLLLLPRAPIAAGVVLGLAGAVKPQLFVLLPLALVLVREWRALLAWGLSGLSAVLLSLGLFGFEAWQAWLHSLGAFQALFEGSQTLLNVGITPYSNAQRFGLSGTVPWLAGLLGALCAIWAGFRAGRGIEARLLALVGAALLISPYAMNYELALLAPATSAWARRSLAGAAVLLVAGMSVQFGFGLVGLLASLIPLAMREGR